MLKVEVVENGVQATEKISSLEAAGFGKENVYIFAHDEDRSEHLTDATETGGLGFKEQGFFDSIGNMFKSRGDELRNKFESLGLSKQEAEQYERELDKGRLVLVATDEVK
ncbi:general stress protein [Bacillus sp. ISL-35]|uniref:general stress protein n=1 Tax=Bacillus sp. ISL-35 TaxID=2819122 RepID=UPI001BEA4F77|nr:general stress protein [Bacillus sp. ISL-35]MBT2681834.1 general stress protein [Bacillus sp. ISL-35]MBT2706214.1 general stress protein [Chryseobacterium sp. ISL-80]